MQYFPGRLGRTEQSALVAALRDIIADAPLFTPTMPRSGKEMSVRMTNCGPLGWVTDKERGYRYQPTHPVLDGDDRLAYHCIDRILPGTSDLLAEGGRFNLTLRRVTAPS